MAKTAIITGSTKGIGKNIAYMLANNGYNVVINSRNQQDVEKVAKKITQSANVTAIGIAANVSDVSAVDQMIKKILNEFG